MKKDRPEHKKHKWQTSGGESESGFSCGIWKEQNLFEIVSKGKRFVCVCGGGEQALNLRSHVHQKRCLGISSQQNFQWDWVAEHNSKQCWNQPSTNMLGGGVVIHGDKHNSTTVLLAFMCPFHCFTRNFFDEITRRWVVSAVHGSHKDRFFALEELPIFQQL